MAGEGAEGVPVGQAAREALAMARRRGAAWGAIDAGRLRGVVLAGPAAVPALASRWERDRDGHDRLVEAGDGVLYIWSDAPLDDEAVAALVEALRGAGR